MLKVLIIIFSLSFLIGQDTFSIVAIDTETGEVGSAGASCVAGSPIISDIHPGTGVIHTQALWNPINQDSASVLMDNGNSPEEIISWLINNDAENNPSVRQYGIIDLVNGGRAAAYTGENCYNYKSHVVGKNYVVLGNILLGQDILDTMETTFINQYGTLEEKLISSLMAANIIGADSRCAQFGTPALSAFIRISSYNNLSDSLYLDINLNSVPKTTNPLDSLYTLYWQWKQSKYQKGDCNFDKILDIFDVLSLSDYLNQDHCNFDMILDIFDVLSLSDYLNQYLDITNYISNTGDMNSSGSVEIIDLYLLLYEIIG